MESRLDEAGIPEIRETGEEKLKTFKDLRKFYIQFAKDRFQGKKYRNKTLCEDILVSRDGIDKLEGMLSFREQCIVNAPANRIQNASEYSPFKYYK